MLDFLLGEKIKSARAGDDNCLFYYDGPLFWFEEIQGKLIVFLALNSSRTEDELVYHEDFLVCETDLALMEGIGNNDIPLIRIFDHGRPLAVVTDSWRYEKTPEDFHHITMVRPVELEKARKRCLYNWEEDFFLNLKKKD